MAHHPRLVVDELLTKPSAVSPTLFVGLGGCGCSIVKRVAEHLQRRPDFAERYRDLVKFALVDTNVNDLEKHREIADDTFLISDFEKEEYADLASGKLFLEPDDYFTQWVPPDYRFRAGDTAGAGQIRIESRLGIFYQMKHKDFVARFRKLLEELKRHEHGHRRLDTPEIRIIVCYSVAGGTGSGGCLPIAYMLRDQARELGKPWVVGVAVLPSVFEDKTGVNKDGTFANGYAALKETEHLMKLGAPDSRFFPDEGLQFHYDPSQSSHRKVRERPFEFLYVVDKPESFTVEEPVKAAADGLYLQFFSPLYTHQASDYDNYTQHQRFLVPHDFEGKGIVGFTSFYGSYGSAVLLVPVPGLVEYCSQAAALSLMRSSFLRSIPGEPVYSTLRADRQPFREVTLGEDKSERPIDITEFDKKESLERDRLYDRLYMKRVRLLAHCELGEGVSRRFHALFRHGHLPGESPTHEGGWQANGDRARSDQKKLSEQGMSFSIASVVLTAITSQTAGRRGGLLEQAAKTIGEHAESFRTPPAGRASVAELKIRASGWLEEFRRVGRKILRDGYRDGTLKVPGVESLTTLEFLREDAAEVDLAAKRFAVLSILERVDWDLRPPEINGGFELDREDSDSVKDRDQQEILESLEAQAIERAMGYLTRELVESLGKIQEAFRKFAAIHRVLEQGFGKLERDRAKRLEILREQGEQSANQYELDAEALQTEDGRRLWDFYYEDRVAGLPELTLGDRNVQRVLTDTITAMSARGGASKTTTLLLEQMFQGLVDHAHAFLSTHIAGDPHSADPAKHKGLTLSEAFELEVVYRALYRSNAEKVDVDGHKAIRDLVSEYNYLPADQKIDLNEPRHKDYLRDKIKRVVKEKASLLCVYDESRDQHGGVRPDHVFLAAIDEDFGSSTIAEAIQSADSGLHWVTSGWHNPKEIVFYRSVLNVPLYVFGRMNEMRDNYHEFRNLAKRPKVLHIDRNWEYSLPDLDPQSAKERHRQNLLRNHVVNFAALLTTGPAGAGKGAGFVVRRNGTYFLLAPPGAVAQEDTLANGGPTELGRTLATAIEHLPETLDAEKVKFLPYQRMLRGVREGLAPQVVSQIVHLPFQWRRNRDELRTQYGPDPTPEQTLKLKDYTDAYSRLQEALANLLERLRNRSIEQKTLGDDTASQALEVKPDEARRNLEQTLEILDTFCRTWELMEDPNRPGPVSKPFSDLFRELPPKDLSETLESLRELSSEE